MSDLPATIEGLDDQALLYLVSGGDTARLNPKQKLAYYLARCTASGLDPRKVPFSFIRLGNREVLYALKGASEQLASLNGVALEILTQGVEGDLYVVTVRATARDGRRTDELAAVPIKGLSPQAACDARMKCVTKGKRRAILSLSGEGINDESELEHLPGAVKAPLQIPDAVNVATGEVVNDSGEELPPIAAYDPPPHLRSDAPPAPTAAPVPEGAPKPRAESGHVPEPVGNLYDTLLAAAEELANLDPDKAKGISADGELRYFSSFEGKPDKHGNTRHEFGLEKLREICSERPKWALMVREKIRKEINRITEGDA